MSQGEESSGTGAVWLERPGPARPTSDAARKRAAVEMIAQHEAVLKRTARRYSLDAEDADDAYQRALEIVLTKAPTSDQRELIRWTQTVTKHEALAVRHNRERLLGAPASPNGPFDRVALIPAESDGPDEQAERREEIARSREALRALKPAELRALTLLAEGYSYAEIGEITGFSRTKINRVLSEGRNRFRNLLASSEDGSRCRELHPLLSAVCDGEASAAEAAKVREHLRACARCRSTMRAYRAAPGIAAALAPTLSISRSLLERAQDLLAGLGSRIPGVGGGADPVAQAAVTAGAQGGSLTALSKLLVVCAGAAGGTAACMATGVLPSPLDGPPEQTRKPAIEQAAPEPIEPAADEGVKPQPARQAPSPSEQHEKKPRREEAVEPTAESVSSVPEAVEYEPPPAPPPPVPAGSDASPSASSSSDSAAGEFGP